ncbi:MAG: septum formation initiator family protein [Acidimicrobiia bacterium]|nr:septum formation initiator family protein [Acidimicrobiia bacterium]MCL4291633.1 septum formation initiator family protein [Acidimicrobiia bacterium]
MVEALRARSTSLKLLAGALVLVAVLFLWVFPTSSVLSQRRQLDRAEDRLRFLAQQNRALERESRRLQSDAAVEEIARERYQMVRPGERAWAVVPESPTPTTAPRPGGGAGAPSP